MSDEAERIIAMSLPCVCDQGRAAHLILDALVAANLQEDDGDGSDKEYDRKSEAETLLFCLATEWKQHCENPGQRPVPVKKAGHSTFPVEPAASFTPNPKE